MPTATMPSSEAAPALDPEARRERWAAACHESGHLTASLSLAERPCLSPPECWASIYKGGSGTTYTITGWGCSDQDAAVHAACGLLAERLADIYPVPDDVEPEPLRSDPDVTRAADAGRQPTTDQERIHRYVTGSVRGGITTMISRWRTVYKRARTILRDRRSFVLAIAKELYVSGRARTADVREIAGKLPAPAGRHPASSR